MWEQVCNLLGSGKLHTCRQRRIAVVQERRGFTLVEMLVSMALILFLLAILTEAFSAGMEAFRQLKAIGDMQDRLRSTASILRRDLAADHFEGSRRLSDPAFWTQGIPQQ